MEFRKAILRGEIVEDYFVDPEGNIWSIKSGTMKKLTPHWDEKNKYPRVRMDFNNKKQTILVHRVVCETFHKKPIPKIYTKEQWKRLPDDLKEPLLEYLQHADQWQVNHKDHNRINYHPDNLEWVSVRDNAQKYQEHRSNKNDLTPEYDEGIMVT